MTTTYCTGNSITKGNWYIDTKQSPLSDIAQFIRKEFPMPGKREACFMCGRFASITQAHHVVPVKELAGTCKDIGTIFFNLPVWFVWLCPNHHLAWHIVANLKEDRAIEVIGDLTVAEAEKFTALADLVKTQRKEILACYVVHELEAQL